MKIRLIDIDKWQEILDTISRNKLRTFLTCVGVFWGIMMLILLLGSGKGLENGVNNVFGSYATNSMYIWAQETTMPYKGLKEGRYFDMTNADYEQIKREVTELELVSPRNQLGGFQSGNNVSRKNVSGNFQVMGDYPGYRFIQNLVIREGRFLNMNDLREKRKVCVIGEQVERELYTPGENPIGDYITIKGVYFEVIGIFKTKKVGDEADRDSRTIYTPFTTFQTAFNFGDQVSWFALMLKPGVDAAELETKIRKLLAENHDVHPDDERAFGSFNVQEESNRFNSLFTFINVFVGFVGVLTIIAGAVGISNIMLIVVTERTKEIGIRKALGATPGSIMLMVVQESVFLTTLSGWLGLCAGVGALELTSWLMEKMEVESMFFLHPEVSLQTAIIATIILIASGALAGLMPAFRAARVNPIEALRTE